MARGKTVTLRLDKIERGAFSIAVWRGKQAIEHGLRLEAFDEPDMLMLAAAKKRLDDAPSGDLEITLSLAEALELEIAAEVGFAVIRSQALIQNTAVLERAKGKLKAAIL